MNKTIAIAAIAGLAASTSVMAQGTDVASATVINAPTSGTVTGTVSSDTPGTLTEILRGDYTVDVGSIFSNSLGNADHGLSAGDAFTLFTTADYDSEMRTLDAALAQIEQDDDDGPGLGSQIEGTVNSDDTINFDVSWWQDDAFTGATTGGSAEWVLNTVSGGVPGVTGQFWRFTGLSAGDQMDFATGNGSGVTDTVMTAYDSLGNVLAHNDDDTGLYSGFSAIAGADGEIIVAVSGYHGLFNDPTQSEVGYHLGGGDDDGTFDLTYNFVPAPGSFALVGLGGLVMTRRRRA